jgi:hypothetical protein
MPGFAALALLLAASPAASAPPSMAPPAGLLSAPVPVAVPDAGLESPGAWVPARPSAPGTSTAADPAVRHGGAASLRVSHERTATTEVLSAPLALQVGRFYRLSAWIRTERALSDPAARYPTALPACVTMDQLPFTTCSRSVGGTRDWSRVELVFVALASRDRVALTLGRNGGATGTAWFDDVELAEVPVTDAVPLEAVRWAGPAFRYDDRGWIVVHVEGEPHARGVQLGTLVADELAEYVRKLANLENPKDPASAWAQMRLMADALFLRKYDVEFLEEMRGIAAGAAAAGAKVDGRPVDLLDVVTLNSAVDLGEVAPGLKVTGHGLTGRSFLSAEEELKLDDRAHKCSGLAATGPATADGRVLFAHLFMWNGYTGVHFNVILDVVPARGHRLVFQTFPGGIHSGTDWYMNGAGLLMSETTVLQTPFDPAGSPQSNRVRRAAQYASSIDEAAALLSRGNNGLYTNDWPMADVKRNETAVFLLGTHRSRLWKSGDRPPPFGSPGFLWANNNPRDAEVRKEYAVQPDDAPFDSVFTPWDRDIAFRRLWAAGKGKLDLKTAIQAFSSSPINRPHACDGKVTNGEMAERLVFVAHQGKTTHREKFPAPGSRRMPDLPGAQPHLAHGWTAFSPIRVAEQLRLARAAAGGPPAAAAAPKLDLSEVEPFYKGDKSRLWKGTVFPASEADGALASGSAAYWQVLAALGEDPAKGRASVSAALGDAATRLLWVVAREGDVAPSAARRSYETYAPYRIARVKGTFLLHQLRLMLGTDPFLAGMRAYHARHAGQAAGRAELVAAFREATGKDVAPLVAQWLDRAGLPDPRPSVRAERSGDGWVARIDVVQDGTPWHLFGTVSIEAGGKEIVRRFEVDGARASLELRLDARPTRIRLAAGWDFPVPHDLHRRLGNYSDDWSATTVVHGTSRQLEASRTLALRWQATIADAISEDLPPVVKDAEVDDDELGRRDLMVLGAPSDNVVSARAAAALRQAGVDLEFGTGWFRFQGRTYARPDEGIVVSAPNPWNPRRGLTLLAANSALELYRMTKAYVPALAPWALFRGDEAKEQGFFEPERLRPPLDPAP